MKNIAISIITLLITLIIIEVFSTLTMSEEERMPLLWVSSEKGPAEEGVSLIFDCLDPLLGWSMSEERLRHTGFEVTDGFIVLRSQGESETLRILITGGSTTDLAVLDHNWPIVLRERLEELGIRSVIHVGAVGGYNSGQELLRLIRDGIHLRPHIHISYSGANEADPHFVTMHERTVFRSLFTPKFPLMPNTQMAVRRMRGGGNMVRLAENASVEKNRDTDVASFWAGNMRLMNAVAIGHGYRFMGVLQPVLGSGTYTQPVHQGTHVHENVESYHGYYPLLRDSVTIAPGHLIDLSGLFDYMEGGVFSDDCHLNPGFQPPVAEAILQALAERGMLPTVSGPRPTLTP